MWRRHLSPEGPNAHRIAVKLVKDLVCQDLVERKFLVAIFQQSLFFSRCFCIFSPELRDAFWKKVEVAAEVMEPRAARGQRYFVNECRQASFAEYYFDRHRGVIKACAG